MSANRQRMRHSPAKRRGSGTWVWIVAVGVVVVVGVLAIVVSRSDSSAAANEIGKTITVNGTPLPPLPAATKENPAPADPAIGMTLPSVTGTAPDGKTVTLGPTGKPMLFFGVAHWCPHCQAEMPRIKEYQDEGLLTGVDLQVLSTGQNESKPNWPPSQWLKSEGPTSVVLADNAKVEAAVAFGVTGYPAIIAVDKDGKVVGRTSGEQGREQIVALANAARSGQPIAATAGGASSQRK